MRIHTYYIAAGFTLIESMVAISILFLAITGPLTLMNQSIISSRIARDRVRATYLAQEGVELARNFRDNEALLSTGSSWLGTINTEGCVGVNSPCAYHPWRTDAYQARGNFGVCSSGICPKLTISPDVSVPGGELSGLLNLNTGNPSSLFSRTVVVTETVPDREALIVSTVRWTVGSREHEVIIEDILLNWQP